MSKWTDQQKLLNGVKLIGGAAAGLVLVGFAAKHGIDSVNKLITEVDEEGMGIDNSIEILELSNKLGAENSIDILSKELDNIDEDYDNVIEFIRKRG